VPFPFKREEKEQQALQSLLWWGGKGYHTPVGEGIYQYLYGERVITTKISFLPVE